jgi:hypothetical protein
MHPVFCKGNMTQIKIIQNYQIYVMQIFCEPWSSFKGDIIHYWLLGYCLQVFLSQFYWKKANKVQ